MNSKNYILETFLTLTSKTCPHGWEDIFYYDVIRNICRFDLKKDNFGNYYYKIGNSNTIFSSHIDTISNDYRNVKRLNDNGIIKTDRKTTLGADDKAGMTIMFWMMENKIPGLYYFFIGEEKNCVGSTPVSLYSNLEKNYNKIISFDRRGTDSVITHQSGLLSCSEDFANSLCKQLNKFNMNYKKDPTGIYTDSYQFIGIINECTNISVGYYNEHSVKEFQNINHLIDLSDACLNVDWENLPISNNLK